MEYKGKIKFYDDEIVVLFPENFQVCKKKISQMIQINEEEILKKVTLSYTDEEGDNIELNCENDYLIFINGLKENNLLTINIQLKEESEIIKKKMSVEINNYKEKHSNEIINFDKQNSLEISNELKDIDKSKNDNINKINIDNNKDDENNIINNNDLNKNDIIQEKNDAENIVTYQETCTNCKASPLYGVLYYCTRCSIIYCSKCESERGSIHIHPLYKIQSFDQYMNSDIKLKEKFNNKIEEYRSNFKDFIGGLNNIVNNNQNNNNNEKDYKALVQQIKNDYDLKDSNIPDEKIEEAIRANNGDIDKTMDFLFNYL